MKRVYILFLMITILTYTQLIAQPSYGKSIKETARDIGDQKSTQVKEAKQQMVNKANEIKDKTGEGVEKAKGAVNSAKDKVGESVGETERMTNQLKTISAEKREEVISFVNHKTEEITSLKQQLIEAQKHIDLKKKSGELSEEEAKVRQDKLKMAQEKLNAAEGKIHMIHNSMQ